MKECVFEMSIEVEKYVHFIDVLTKVLDEATMEFSIEGIKLRQMNPSQELLVDVVLPKEVFREYKVWRAGKIVAAAELKTLEKFIKRATKDAILVFRVFGEETDKGEKISLSWKTHSVKSREFEADSVDYYNDLDLKMPKLNTTVEVGLDVKEFIKSLEDIQLVSDHVELSANNEIIVKGRIEKEEGFNLRGEGDSKVGVYYRRGDPSLVFLKVNGEETRETYNISYLKDLLKPVKGNVELEFGANMPLVLKFDVADGGAGTYFLVPREESKGRD